LPHSSFLCLHTLSLPHATHATTLSLAPCHHTPFQC